jgi:3-hydroxyisobutyrate dehydrogenase-like beta-hydroxyacid dehydrogenase
MGRALAAAFLTAGHRTTVWNRTTGRASDLVGKGAIEVATVAEAVAASSLTVVCVLGRDAVEAVLEAAGDGLAGASVANLTSSTPADARALAVLAEKAGARYLDGKIMVPTPLVGTGDGHYLYAGDAALFEEHAATLAALGGEADLLGDDHGLAALYDLAMLDVFFNGMTAFLHAAALVGAEGVSATRFLDYARRVIPVLDLTMGGLAADVDGGDHPGHEDNLVMDEAALGHIVEASAAAGIDTTVPALPRDLAVAAIGRGHGADGWSRVVDLLRQPVR